jgi:hypothetical protein
MRHSFRFSLALCFIGALGLVAFLTIGLAGQTKSDITKWRGVTPATPITPGAVVVEHGSSDPLVSALAFSPCSDARIAATIEISETAATTTIQVVAPTSSVRVYFCGGQLRLGGAATTTFTMGTSSDCTTSVQTFATLRAAEDEFIFNQHSDSSIHRSDVGDGFCFTRSASVTAEGFLTFARVTE